MQDSSSIASKGLAIPPADGGGVDVDLRWVFQATTEEDHSSLLTNLLAEANNCRLIAE